MRGIQDGDVQSRRVGVPPHRLTPLKENWMNIYTPIVEHMHLQIRMNLRARQVEIRVCFWILLA